MDTAEIMFPEYPPKEKISKHMRLWAETLKTQKGALSIDATAARFLQAADHLSQVLDQTPEMQAAAFAFADAWHWWHLEMYGEHALSARFHTWDRLPLFADEEAISGALMGPGKTAEWRQIAPLLERRGLPTVDGLMGGRYIPALKAFFDREYNIHGESQVSSPHAPAELGSWKKKGRQA